MKQKGKQKKARASKSILMIMVASFIIGAGCNNDDKTKEGVTKNDSTTKETSEPASVSRLYGLSGYLHTLKMSKAQYDDTVKTPGAIKYVLQFYFDTTNPKSPTLIAYASKQNNKFFKTSEKIPDTLSTGQPVLDIEEKMVFGDNEITFRELNKFIKANTTGGSYTYIVFTPRIDTANKHIYYRVTLEGTASALLVGVLDTNPSPPKDAD